jgi:hypothetical protein
LFAQDAKKNSITERPSLVKAALERRAKPELIFYEPGSIYIHTNIHTYIHSDEVGNKLSNKLRIVSGPNVILITLKWKVYICVSNNG